MNFIARIQKMHRITIPKAIVGSLNLEPGDMVKINLTVEHRLK